MDFENPLLSAETVLNRGGKNSTTLKTTVPSNVRKFLYLEAKDKLVWQINLENNTVTVKKADNNSEK